WGAMQQGQLAKVVTTTQAHLGLAVYLDFECAVRDQVKPVALLALLALAHDLFARRDVFGAHGASNFEQSRGRYLRPQRHGPQRRERFAVTVLVCSPAEPRQPVAGWPERVLDARGARQQQRRAKGRPDV